MKREMLTSTSSSEPSSRRDCRSAWQRRVSTSTTPTHSRKGLKRHSDIIKTGSRSRAFETSSVPRPSSTSTMTQREGNPSHGQFFLRRGSQDTSGAAGAHRAEFPREECARQGCHNQSECSQRALTIFRAEGSVRGVRGRAPITIHKVFISLRINLFTVTLQRNWLVLRSKWQHQSLDGSQVRVAV